METLTKAVKAKIPKQIVRVYSKRKKMKELVEKYYEEIHEGRMTTKQAMEGIAEEYNQFMDNDYYKVGRVVGYSIGLTPKDEWDDGVMEENVIRPKKTYKTRFNCRYEIYEYEDSFFAIETDNRDNRKRINTLWKQYDGLEKIPENEVIQGIVFDKTVNIEDTALIEAKGHKTSVRIKDLIIQEINIEYLD